MKTLFNDGWSFALLPVDSTFEDIKAGTEFKPVDLPHDWLIYDTENLYASGTGCYRKTFKAEAPDKRMSLIFDGVYMDSKVFVNGKQACEWKNGYTPFVVGLNGFLIEGENTVTVLVNYKEPNTRWYSGAGIFRDVYIEKQEMVHIVHDGIYINAKPLSLDEDGVPCNEWLIDTSIELINENSGDDIADCMIKNVIEQPDGTPVCSFEGFVSAAPAGLVPYEKVSVAPAEYATVFNKCVSVVGPHLWDTFDPYLYKLKTFVFKDTELMDTVETCFGFRHLRLDPAEGFFLNGRHVKLNGACMHHDLGALGAAFNLKALERQFKSLRSMGINAVRTSHNPPALPLLKHADKTGMLIDTEFSDMWARTKTKYDYGNYFNDWCERDVAAWVRRDRNHPSIIMWSIGNEIYDTFFENEGLPIAKRLSSYVRFHDPKFNAFTTIGSNYIEWENAQKCAEELDASGYNYGERLYNKHHEEHPEWVIYGSETSSTVQSRGIYHFPASKRLLTHDDNQCSALGNCTTNWGAKDTSAVITLDRDAKFSLGQFIWTGWDYIGEPTPYFTKNSYFGQVDTAGFNKDTFYLYQAEWTDAKTAPMVHILPYWDFNNGQLIDVKVYTNAAVSELFFNDKSVGRFEHDHENGQVLSGCWHIPYEKGVLKAVAYDEDGNIVATESVSSFADTAKLLLTADKKSLKADGEDLIFVEIKAVDEDGNFVANARNRVNVELSGAGRLLGLDNGDSTDYEQYKGTSRRLFSGRLLAIIGSTKNAGEVVLTVNSPGLASSKLCIPVENATPRKGVSCITENYRTPAKDDVPIRKIKLSRTGESGLTPEAPSCTVTASLLPSNTTYTDIVWKAISEAGVDANFVKLASDGTTATVTAFGDGDFRLICTASNGTKYPCVLSEYEFTATGFGVAGIDPYTLVYASLRSRESNDAPLSLSFQGGINTGSSRSYMLFENVQFGDYGSDEITIPIFHWETEIPLEIWEGCPDEGGELLLKCTYKHESVYNHYNSNTFKLPRRLRGTTSLSIVTFARISVQGFSFTKYDKAFMQIPAVECTNINGDTFKLEKDIISGIGNNVTVEFANMDFGDKGTSRITICGRTPNTANAIHIFFNTDGGTFKQMVAFKEASDFEEQTFELEKVTGSYTIAFVFLPGSDFDFKYFRFE